MTVGDAGNGRLEGADLARRARQGPKTGSVPELQEQERSGRIEETPNPGCVHGVGKLLRRLNARSIQTGSGDAPRDTVWGLCRELSRKHDVA